MGTLSNPRYERFAQELAKGIGTPEAYVNAGFSYDRPNAWRLQQKEEIKQRVDELLQQRARMMDKATEKATERLAINRQWVLARLVENAERALQVHPVLDKEGNETGEFIYDGNVANRALELVGKEMGMFISRSEVGNPGDFNDLHSIEEIMATIQKELGPKAALLLSSLIQEDSATNDGPDGIQ
jgi:phage terminase small subunit